jgi:hypothetical protein
MRGFFQIDSVLARVHLLQLGRGELLLSKRTNNLRIENLPITVATWSKP